MNKNELLKDLESKEWCDSINGEPELKEIKADGGKWYLVNIREVQGGNVGIYRNIHFYVVDEGLPTEKAYYKDAVPEVITKKQNTFTDKIKSLADKDGLMIVERIEEERKFAIVKKYIETEQGVNEKRVIVREIDGELLTEELI